MPASDSAPSVISASDLDRLYRQPAPHVRDKAKDQVDEHGRSFIALSPFCVIAAAGPDGSMDVSPRGGEPGFVHVSEDGRSLFLPDRTGNNRLDTLRNLLSGSGRIGMMFMIPGFDDIYRVNGRATLSDDAALLSDFVEFGKPPRTVLRILVDEAFIHCPKALMRAKLWSEEHRVSDGRLPTVTQMVMDYSKAAGDPLSEEQILAGYREQF